MPYGAVVAGLEAGKPLYKVVVPKKLPLGGSVSGSKDPGLFRVYVPTRDGCELTLKTTAGQIEVYAPDGSPARDAAGRAVPKGAQVVFETPDGVSGWFGVVVTGSQSYQVSAKCKIAGHAKDADGSMLVPWHFYYFPFTEVGKPGHASSKYDSTVGGTSANAWEKTSYWKSEIDSHGSRGSGQDGHGITEDAVKAYNAYRGKEVVKYEDCWWWGHCDAASTASTIFTKPQAHGGMQPIDIKWALTELSMRGYDIELKFHLGGINGDGRNAPSNRDVPSPAESQAVDRDVGPLHEALVECVKKDAHVALMDFRAPYEAGQDHSGDVWNQACYKFTMDLRQADEDRPGGDEEASARKIHVDAVLTANADNYSAAASGGDPESTGGGWLRQLEYVIHFDDKGRVAVDHPKNNFMKCEWKEENQKLYAPRYIFKIRGLRPDGPGPGNKQVTMAGVNALGVKRRAVFGG
jgi:hypothetical protein